MPYILILILFLFGCTNEATDVIGGVSSCNPSIPPATYTVNWTYSQPSVNIIYKIHYRTIIDGINRTGVLESYELFVLFDPLHLNIPNCNLVYVKVSAYNTLLLKESGFSEEVSLKIE